MMGSGSTAGKATVWSARSEKIVDGASHGSGSHSLWIDALRGIAAAWVILYHSRMNLWVGLREKQNKPTAFPLSDRLFAKLSVLAALGGGAVMLFFVISGFCVHAPYAGGNKQFQVRQYSIRRGFRILPPYLAAVIFTFGLEA